MAFPGLQIWLLFDITVWSSIYSAEDHFLFLETCILKKSDWLRPSSMFRSFRKSWTVSSQTYLFFLFTKNNSDWSLEHFHIGKTTNSTNLTEFFFFTHLMTDSSWTWWWWWSVNKTFSASTSLASRYSKVYWRRKTKLKRRCERVYLDVFSPCYENQDEAGGEEDEEECSNNFQAAQLVTTYLLYGSITYITCMVVSHISHIYHIYHMYITCMGVTTCHISYIGVSFHSIWSKCPFFRISVKAREQKVLTERERLTGLRDWVLTPVMFVDTATPHMETNFHHSLFFNRVLTHKMGCRVKLIRESFSKKKKIGTFLGSLVPCFTLNFPTWRRDVIQHNSDEWKGKLVIMIMIKIFILISNKTIAITKMNRQWWQLQRQRQWQRQRSHRDSTLQHSSDEWSEWGFGRKISVWLFLHYL